MKSNNPFEVHDIKYLSPSNMNTYISDMPMWVARYLFGIKSGSGAGAVRGIVQEAALADKYKTGKFDFDAEDDSNGFVRIIGYCIDIDSSDILLRFKPDNTWVVIA